MSRRAHSSASFCPRSWWRRQNSLSTVIKSWLDYVMLILRFPKLHQFTLIILFLRWGFDLYLHSRIILEFVIAQARHVFLESTPNVDRALMNSSVCGPVFFSFVGKAKPQLRKLVIHVITCPFSSAVFSLHAPPRPQTIDQHDHRSEVWVGHLHKTYFYSKHFFAHLLRALDAFLPSDIVARRARQRTLCECDRRFILTIRTCCLKQGRSGPEPITLASWN